MKENEPLVSVGIPCYNRPEGLRRTLECITGQTYRNLEIIISDNCSPDSRVENIGREFTCRDLRVQYHRQDVNKGSMANFQLVLEKATGEYFMWAADDDLLDLDYIKSLMAIHSINNYSLVGASWHLEGPSGILKNVMIELPERFWGNLNPNYSSLKLFLKTPHMRTEKYALIYGIYRREKLVNYILSKKADFFQNILVVGSDLLFVYAMICNGPVYALNKKIWIHHIDWELKKITFCGKLFNVMTIFFKILINDRMLDKEIDIYTQEIRKLSETCVNGTLRRMVLFYYIWIYKLKLRYWYYV